MLLTTVIKSPQLAAHVLYAVGIIGPKNGIAAYAARGSANEPATNMSTRSVRKRIHVSYRAPPAFRTAFPLLSHLLSFHYGLIRERICPAFGEKIRAYSLAVKFRSPKPTSQVRVLVGPQKMNKAIRCDGFELVRENQFNPSMR